MKPARSPHGMYLAHFGLRTAPFGITPDPAFFYPGNTRGELLAALLYAVTQGEGIIKLTGEVGSGKTMLCRMLAERLPAPVDVLYLLNPSLEADEVMHAIAAELGLDTTGHGADAVLRALHGELIARHAAGCQVVLLAEEAQAMPVATLEALRLLTNLETASHKLLQIVLFGQPELEHTLALPQLRQLKERITHSFTVPRLPPSLLGDYLACRLAAAGRATPLVFTPQALRRLARASQGIVRRINILADKALLAAYADDAQQVAARHLRLAIADSPFGTLGPAPWHAGTLLARALIAVMLLLAGALLWQWLAPLAASTPAPASMARPAADTGTGATGTGAPATAAVRTDGQAPAPPPTPAPTGVPANVAAGSMPGTRADRAPGTSDTAHTPGAAFALISAPATAAASVPAPASAPALASMPPSAPPVRPASAPASTSVSASASAAPLLATASAPAGAASSRPSRSEARAQGSPGPTSPAQRPAPTPLLDSSLAASRAWLARQEPQQLVLHVASMPASDAATAEAFLQQAQQAIGLRDIHVFRLRAKVPDAPDATLAAAQADLHAGARATAKTSAHTRANAAKDTPASAAWRLAIVYGSFADRASAQAVWARLTTTSPQKPLLSNIDSIRKEMISISQEKP
ncbi:AAA family ATPase [Janthinobacterium sp. SUN118]|uniref:ExeA family protein n=1 Tax=Janthinobacterium sp. SUN118 TaxID=3004100 RepID=UPI0025B27ABE|nr:AAA family ATPase [Janthinobacterium sp. SUN118]MDN2709648.1 AAA family ATPase [Janthinobacterium sp. SUN118]